MSLAGLYEAALDLKASADENYKKWSHEAHRIPEAIGHHIQGVALHEGDWKDSGSIRVWDYTCEGKAEVFKEKVELNDEEKAVRLIGVGGHVMEEMKVYDIVIQYVPKQGGGAVAKITMKWEKLNENIRDPTRYFEFVKNIVIDLDEHLIKK